MNCLAVKNKRWRLRPSTYSRLSESIRTYSTVVTEWFQSCLKYVAFNHADLNSNLVFLFPLAGLMYLSGSVTAASYIMYLFMGLAMLIPLETVSNNFDYIQNADQILVLSDGILQGCGKHEELLQTVPLYQTMWEKEKSIKNWKLA